MIIYNKLIELWFRLRVRWLCWRHGADFVFRMIERNLVEMGATVETSTPQTRVYKFNNGIITVTAEMEEVESD